MKCTIEQNTLAQILTEAQRFVSGKALNPILGGIYLEAQAKTLIVRASTGQAMYQTILETDVETEGVVVVPAQMIVSIVKSLDKGQVTLEKLEEELLVTQKGVEFRVAMMPAEDFPPAPSSEGAEKFLLPTEAFIAASEKVLVAASRDESKPVLTSLLIEMSQPNALVASDGFRLFRINVDLSLDLPERLLLPARLLREVMASVKKTDISVISCFWNRESSQVTFDLGSTLIQMSQVVGDFPNYRAIIPEACSFSLTLDRDALRQRLQQIMVVAKELSSIVVFEPTGEELSVASQLSVRGSSAGKLTPLKVDGDVPKFACNGNYILEFLSTIDTLEVTIQGTDPLKPVIFGIPEDPNLLYLVMPFKLQS